MNMVPPTSESADGLPRSLAGKYLTFKLLGESYGIDVLAVREIVHHIAIHVLTPMPCGICGAIHLRGSVIPIMDLCARCPSTGALGEEENYITVVQIKSSEGRAATLGLVMDELEEMVNISRAEIESPVGCFGAISADHIIGIARLPSGVKALLNLNGLISQNALEELCHAA